jgi:hypothetical protein
VRDPDTTPRDRIETRTSGFDDAAPTPATPSERADWDKKRHEAALEFHRKQNERPGMHGDVARRNQYCPGCRGVIDWRAETCPHCGAAVPAEMRDYYNFSDFEAPVERGDLLPIVTAFAVIAVALGAVVAGLWFLVRWVFG